MGRIYTAHCVYDWEDRVDVTTEGGDPLGALFAPSWDLRFASLEWRSQKTVPAGEQLAFAKGYQREVELTRRANPGPWRELLTRPVVTLVCFCTRPSRCHRALLAEMLADSGADYHGERSLPYANPFAIEHPGREAEAQLEMNPPLVDAGLWRIFGEEDTDP